MQPWTLTWEPGSGAQTLEPGKVTPEGADLETPLGPVGLTATSSRGRPLEGRHRPSCSCSQETALGLGLLELPGPGRFYTARRKQRKAKACRNIHSQSFFYPLGPWAAGAPWPPFCSSGSVPAGQSSANTTSPARGSRRLAQGMAPSRWPRYSPINSHPGYYWALQKDEKSILNNENYRQLLFLT